MFRFKNPDETKETKGKVKKETVLDKSRVPFMEYVLRLFYVLLFITCNLCTIYLAVALIGGIVGYFVGAVGISMEVSTIETLLALDLYSLLFVLCEIILFLSVIVFVWQSLAKLSYRFFIGKLFTQSVQKYKEDKEKR